MDFVDNSGLHGPVRVQWLEAECACVWRARNLKLHRRLYLTVEARYQWTRGDFGADFINFDPIDLSGLHIGTGINIIF